MDVIDDIRKRAASKKRRVVLPGISDKRVLKAAAYLTDQKMAQVILPGNRMEVKKTAEAKGTPVPDAVQFIEPENFSHLGYFAENLFDRRKEKGLTKDEARSLLVNDPLFFGASLVANGAADVCIAGSQESSGEVITAAIKVIGLRKGMETVSSIFLMVMPGGQAYTYADCGVVPSPDEQQLADIAVESARTHRLLTGLEPKVAMLSFSTRGSSEHEKAQMVRRAVAIASEKYKDLQIDGELQFDAAYVPEVAKRKAPGSTVAGHANVFIFPNLDAGNIAYKITERMAGAFATGPLLQGLAQPMMDLSRGCRWEDIVNVACAGILMGEGEAYRTGIDE